MNRRASTIPSNSTIQSNLRYIPGHLAEVYLSIVGNTWHVSDIYSPKRFHDLHDALMRRFGDMACSSGEFSFLEHGETGLRELYFKVNGIEGRLDHNLPFLNVTQVLQFLALASYSAKDFAEVKHLVERLGDTNTFVVLSDFCISATSLLGDVYALRELRTHLFPRAESMTSIAVVLCATESALQRLQRSFSSVVVQEVIPDRYSLRNENCIVVPTPKTKEMITELAEWFAESVLEESDLLWKMAEVMQDPEITRWGFGKEGWLLTSDINTPNNSFPLLWYKPVNHPYCPPFRRVSSRNYENSRWNLRELYWRMILKNRAQL